MTFTLGHQNVQQTDRASDELKTIDAVHNHADAITWNEARDSASAIKGLLGWDEVVAGGLAISWKTAKFDALGGGSKQVMRGGHVGADGTRKGPDNRRVGPSRYVLWAVLREKSSGRLLILATHHAVARADTKHKWRRRLRSKGFAAVATTLADVKKKHPTAKLILTGDLNTVGRITAFARLGIREAKTPATYGTRLRYDRIFGSVSNVRTLRTKSDHRALLATVTLTGEPVPEPPEVPVPRQAKSLDVLLAEVNRLAPNRSKASDGGLGDQAHSSRTSDHNPNSAGVWRARDFTHDPKHGCDADAIAQSVAAMLGKHPALGLGAYVIRNRRIISTSRLNEGWRAYTGSNPHDKHVHVSVSAAASGYDSTRAWGVKVTKGAPAPELNNVEKYRAAIRAADKEFASEVDERRVHFQNMRSKVNEALKEGPTS